MILGMTDGRPVDAAVAAADDPAGLKQDIYLLRLVCHFEGDRP
jgi:hypothetical protein